MSKTQEVKPYLRRIRDWKIRNMVMLYLEARELFNACRKTLQKKGFMPFDKMREMCNVLYAAKEEHHLIFKRQIDPPKKRFEDVHKFMPDKNEIDFMNNIGLLFHRVMVARELVYVMEHYLEESETFIKNKDNLQYQLGKIDELFDEGIAILKKLITQYRDNILLLTLLLENPARTKKNFGQTAAKLIGGCDGGKSLDEVYFSVAKFYADNGWKRRAKKMLKETVKKNPRHKKARRQLEILN